MTTTNMARVETVTFIDPLGETFEADAFLHDGEWVIELAPDMWMLEHDVLSLDSRPAGYNVNYIANKEGDVTQVEVQNLQGLSYFDE